MCYKETQAQKDVLEITERIDRLQQNVAVGVLFYKAKHLPHSCRF